MGQSYDVFGDRVNEESFQTGSSVRRQHDQVYRETFGIFGNLVARIADAGGHMNAEKLGEDPTATRRAGSSRP